MNRKNALLSSIVGLTLAAGAASAQPLPIDQAMELLASLAPGGGGGARSVLVLTTNNEQQQIEIEVGPEAGVVRVWGIDGYSSGEVFTGVSAIDLTTGSNQDYVEFRVYSPVVPEISVDTGAGNSDVKVIYQLNSGAEAVVTEVSHTGGGANDKIAFIVESLGRDLDAAWTVSHANGFNEAAVQINSPEQTGSMDVDFFGSFGSGDDKLDLQIVQQAESLNLAVVGRMLNGNDTFKLETDGLGATNGVAFLDVNMGGGFDDAAAKFIARGGSMRATGTMNGAEGDDKVAIWLEGDGRLETRVIGGPGWDNLDAGGKGSIAGRPRLVGGPDNDFLKIVIDGPRLAHPFLDGGPGYDEAIGFGTFVNIEKIN
ncbi:MAG: hypothetical protein IT431_04360 [Phycisphaerales bacterium]|nr:hypothetical protein [Phycisphaerales bacterium]